MGRNITKRILDSVHGNIIIPSILVEDFIDNQYFQRLRRVEQTSCRSVFPSARHDRFIHSLGVYHIGQQFIDSIIENSNDILPDNKDIVFNSYKLACLLHDVGHSPFSHTFEGFYEQNLELDTALIAQIESQDFAIDIQSAGDMKPHEKMSALIAALVFGEFIAKHDANVELVVRMIIGCHYKVDASKSFENAMIQLIHGDIIDSDRLDYALRDVWAAGYNASSINVHRLIENTCIRQNSDGEYYVCYSSKALNEIESVLNVKNFQNLYIFSHHKIVFEQRLLIEAMKSASQFHWYGTVDNDPTNRSLALRQTCQFTSMLKPLVCKHSKYTIWHPMDDDFVSMMKFCMEDGHVQQWFSRKYKFKPLWKSKAEFYFIFGDLLPKSDQNQQSAILSWFGKGIGNDLKNKFGFSDTDIWVIPCPIKFSHLNPDNITILIDDSPTTLSAISHDGISAYGNQLPFSYIFINYSSDSQKSAIIAFIKYRVEEMIKNESLTFSD